MITFIGVTIITAIIWIPTVCRAKDKSEAAVLGTVTYAISLCVAAAVRFLIS